MGITHNRSIIKRTFRDGNIFMTDTLKIQISAQLVAIMISSDDERIVMLAHSGGSLEIWGAFIDAPEVPRSLKALERVTFQPEVDDAIIIGDPGSMKLLLIILAEKKSYKFDIESLFVRQPNR
jgi:hypothetical protein